MTTALLRKLVAIMMVVVVIASLALWLLTRETYPDVLRIATAAEGGLYYQVGTILEPHLEERSGRDVQVLISRGSVENRELLLRGETDLAIMQGGAVDLEDWSLWPRSTATLYTSSPAEAPASRSSASWSAGGW